MIDLRESEITHILPLFLSEQPEVKALSYAIHRQIKRIIEYMETSMVYSGIDGLPEDVLDALAIEFRSPFYDTTLGVDVKRDIINNTFKWHMTAGTTKAVKELVASVMGQCEIVEWFDYEGDPYHFKAIINIDGTATPERMALAVKLINTYKNVRSILDGVEFIDVAADAVGYAYANNVAQMFFDSGKTANMTYGALTEYKHEYLSGYTHKLIREGEI